MSKGDWCEDADLAAKPTVFVVDDDEGYRRFVAMHLENAGYDVVSLGSAREFMARDETPRPCCLLLDVYMPEMTGLELQEELSSMEASIPMIFISGASGIPEAVRAMKNDAMDFLCKPVDKGELLGAVERAIEKDRAFMAEQRSRRELVDIYDQLTTREKEIFSLVAAGFMNKQMADKLGITLRTVKEHRARVMKKLGVDSLAELVLVAQRLGIVEPHKP